MCQNIKRSTNSYDSTQKINRLNASGFNGLVIAWKALKERNTRSKVTDMNWLRTLRCLSQFSLQNSRTPTLGVVEIYFHLIQMSPFIVSFGVVICLVTSSMWMEVRRFRLNFHNCYGSQKVQTYLLQLLLEVKNLMGSYSDEQGFCSYFRIVERGSNYKLLNINLL